MPPQHIEPRPEEDAIAGSMLILEPPPHRPRHSRRPPSRSRSSSSSWSSRSSARMAASSSRGISMAQANSSASASSAAVGIDHSSLIGATLPLLARWRWSDPVRFDNPLKEKAEFAFIHEGPVREPHLSTPVL